MGQGRYYRTAQNIRQEVADLPGLSSKMRSKYRRAAGTDEAGNIAFANGELDGVAMTQIRSFAGQTNAKGFARYPSETLRKQLQIPARMGVDRVGDTEAKILAQLLRATKRGTKGKVFLYTERAACWSCKRAIKRFNELRPDIEIHVRYTFD